MNSIVKRNPLDYIKIIFRRKWLIIIPAVLGIVGGIITANTLPKRYQASTLILVEEGRVMNPLIQGLAVSTSVAQRLTVLREQIAGWDRINQLISSLNLAKDIKTQKDFEDLVTGLRKNIRVDLFGNKIVKISYTGQDPAVSMNIVKNITDIFIQENLKQQGRETEDAIAFINDQLELYKKKLKEGEVAAMEEKLATLLMDSTEKHPMVVDLKRKIETANEEMEQGNYEVKGSAIADTDSEVASLKEELSTLKDELTTSVYSTKAGSGNRESITGATNEKLYKMLLLDRVDKVTARDTSVNQALYDELLKRLETAKITQRLEASRDGTRYTILDPARLPLRPSKPNKPLVLLMGLFFGAGFGLCMVSAVELFDHSFLDTEQASLSLDIPLLAAVSKIITQSDIHTHKMRNIRIVILSVITTVVLAVVIVFNVLLGG